MQAAEVVQTMSHILQISGRPFWEAWLPVWQVGDTLPAPLVWRTQSFENLEELSNLQHFTFLRDASRERASLILEAPKFLAHFKARSSKKTLLALFCCPLEAISMLGKSCKGTALTSQTSHFRMQIVQGNTSESPTNSASPVDSSARMQPTLQMSTGVE